MDHAEADNALLEQLLPKVKDADADIIAACFDGDFDGFKQILNNISEQAVAASARPHSREQLAKFTLVALQTFYNPPGRPLLRRDPLHWAALRQSRPLMHFLLSEVKLDPNAQDEHNLTPLFMFLLSNDTNPVIDLDCAKLLLAAGANPNKLHVRQTPFHAAIRLEASSLVKEMLAHGAQMGPVEERDRKGKKLITPESALHIAAQHEHPEILSLLLGHARERLIDEFSELLNASNAQGDTPLKIAVANNHLEAVKLLCQYGADPLCKTTAESAFFRWHAGWTVFGWACQFADVSLVKVLASTEPVKQHCQRSPEALIRATHGNREVLLFLLNELGINASLAYKTGDTALHVAATQQNISALTILIAARANVNAQNRNGNTPLHNAAVAAASNAIQYLLKKGANPNIKNNGGFTAAELARPEQQLLFSVPNLERTIIAHGTAIATLITPLDEGHWKATCKLLVGPAGCSRDKGIERTGSAFFVQHGGVTFLVTNHHVIEKCAVAHVCLHPEEFTSFPVSAMYIDADADLACIWVSAFRLAPPSAILTLWNPALTPFPPFGHAVHALGYPTGYEGTGAVYSNCCLGGTHKQEGKPYYVLTGGGIAKGNSGGPLVMIGSDRKTSCVIGVIRSVVPGAAISEAIPIETLHNFLQRAVNAK